MNLSLKDWKDRFASVSDAPLPDDANSANTAPEPTPPATEATEATAPEPEVEVQPEVEQNLEKPEATLEELLTAEAERTRQEVELTQAALEEDKWLAFSQQLERAANLRAELSQIESRLAVHQQEITTRRQQEEYNQRFAAAASDACAIARRQEQRLKQVGAGLLAADALAREFRTQLQEVLGTVIAYQQDRSSYQSLASSYRGALADAVRDQAGGGALFAAQTQLPTGFENAIYHPDGNSRYELAKLRRMDELTWKIIALLLEDDATLSKMQEHDPSNAYALQAWFPKLNRPQNEGTQLIIMG
jgi:hypothetical protein